MTSASTFDYIIVGAGSAGCVLANRLTASGEHTVLLLEAGGEDADKNIHIPAAFAKLFETDSDWNYKTEPQEHLAGRRLYQPRGKTLGGSSSLNAMIYIRGHAADYDGWAASGARGWDADSVEPYFERSFGPQADAEHHALHVSDQVSPNSHTQRFIEAGVELGYPRNDDFNHGDQEGFGLYKVTQKEGARWSAARAYLQPARQRPNLTVWTNARALRVATEAGRATGVHVDRDGERVTAHAAREVILASGAFGSPHLLMLSGIGPAEHLKEHGIDVVHDLPGVGENLQDHLAHVVSRRSNAKDTLDLAEAVVRVGKNLFDYFVHKRGPFTSNVGEGGAFVKSDESLDAPDVQYHLAPTFFLGHGSRNPAGVAGYSVAGLVLTPESRGTVRLGSADARAKPLVDPRYFSDARGEDLRRTVWAFRLGQRIADARAFADVNAGPYEPERVLTSDEEIIPFLRTHSETLYHPVGTCKVGVDDQAVVDPDLRVHGIRGLRVVDASIMPTVTRGNTNAPTIMIAERAADLILAAEPVAA